MQIADIRRQFELSWDMLDEVMGRCTNAVWRLETPPPYAIGRLAFHTIQSTLRYCRAGCRAKVNLDPFNFGGNEGRVPMEQFPDIAAVLEYSRASRVRVMKWMDTLRQRDLSISDGSFLWTGRTVGERLLYTLKHINHHVGQMNLILRQQGIDAVGWKC